MQFSNQYGIGADSASNVQIKKLFRRSGTFFNDRFLSAHNLFGKRNAVDDKDMRNDGADKSDKSKSSTEGRKNADALIASKLRGYYDSIVEEGTPDHLLDLLERLQEAERKMNEPRE
ncbi:NepR family anti-sigma factor [Rhizobium sp. AAP43]|uniref:NepR family anti-sigma factor n=1 Tax=Rhizobium sp. AAP43 TaxID=1523420 RepID=UPI0012E220E7|nr:NepR family anti-sigma factor [Rhizobium sp. AAP43]